MSNKEIAEFIVVLVLGGSFYLYLTHCVATYWKDEKHTKPRTLILIALFWPLIGTVYGLYYLINGITKGTQYLYYVMRYNTFDDKEIEKRRKQSRVKDLLDAQDVEKLMDVIRELKKAQE